MSYYKKFRIIISTPLWRIYLRWVYQRCITDLKQLKFKPNFQKKDFTCLLCGVGNETTADEFIKFVLSKNSNPKIIIIDIANEQIKAVERLKKAKYQRLNIKIKRINALNLDSYIRTSSLDWIETDGFFEYFDSKFLEKLLLLWRRLLVKNGFVTTRAFSSESMTDRLIDKSRIWLGKAWIGVTLYPHSKEKLRNLFKKTCFKYVEKPFPIPTFKRYSLAKE